MLGINRISCQYRVDIVHLTCYSFQASKLNIGRVSLFCNAPSGKPRISTFRLHLVKDMNLWKNNWKIDKIDSKQAIVQLQEKLYSTHFSVFNHFGHLRVAVDLKVSQGWVRMRWENPHNYDLDHPDHANYHQLGQLIIDHHDNRWHLLFFPSVLASYNSSFPCPPYKVLFNIVFNSLNPNSGVSINFKTWVFYKVVFPKNEFFYK